MKYLLRLTSSLLAIVFLLSCNLCGVECAFASEDHHQSSQVEDVGHAHHHEDEINNAHSDPAEHYEHENEASNPVHSDSEDHGEGELCCTSLEANLNPANLKIIFAPEKNLVGDISVFETLSPQADIRFKRKHEFPPGASPPLVFYLNHLTHAPPVSL